MDLTLMMKLLRRRPKPKLRRRRLQLLKQPIPNKLMLAKKKRKKMLLMDSLTLIKVDHRLPAQEEEVIEVAEVEEVVKAEVEVIEVEIEEEVEVIDPLQQIKEDQEVPETEVVTEAEAVEDVMPMAIDLNKDQKTNKETKLMKPKHTWDKTNKTAQVEDKEEVQEAITLEREIEMAKLEKAGAENTGEKIKVKLMQLQKLPKKPKKKPNNQRKR